LILIGASRAQRGELLAAEQHIKSAALDFAIRLIRATRASNEKADSLNGFRRFELDYPEISAELSAIVLLPAEKAAKALCDLVMRELNATESERAQYLVVARRLGWTT
jgi:hypothetical protein